MNSGTTVNDIDSVTALFGVQEAAHFAESDSRGIRRILVPTNFSEHSDAAFKLAIDLAKQQNATIDLLHVSRFGDGKSELRMMQEQIARFPEAQDVEIVQSIKKGKLHDEILNAEAKGKPDLIIMSRRREGYSLFSLFRSVTAKVRKRARCSVLVVGA
jgi:nucleotide-binding universal stress UspA family protein